MHMRIKDKDYAVWMIGTHSKSLKIFECKCRTDQMQWNHEFNM